MGVVKTILLVAFVIISVLLVLLVLVQNEDNSGMGVFGGANSQAFGARSASVLTKTTGVLVALFFISAFALAFLNKADTGKYTSEDINTEVTTETEIETVDEESSADSKWYVTEPAETKAE